MKRNLVQELKEEYGRSAKAKVFDVTDGVFLAADGKGAPDSAVYQDRIGALYGMAYTIKFACKQREQDFVVGKLEGIYAEGVPMMEFVKQPKEEWVWTMMIRVPEFVTQEDLVAARETLKKKGKTEDFSAVELREIQEGRCVQMLHVGPYENEGETGDQMIAFCQAQGLQPTRWHHEIYLSDPRRVPPEKLKTLLRFPVANT
jgi:hypothetical protein